MTDRRRPEAVASGRTTKRQYYAGRAGKEAAVSRSAGRAFQPTASSDFAAFPEAILPEHTSAAASVAVQELQRLRWRIR
jgi:hypothetical protein